MRILITGGAGFIGSHLAEALLARGHAVHVIDNLSTGSVDNIRHLRSEKGFAETIADCANRAVMAELIDATDVVYHLAAAVGVELVLAKPVQTIKTNLHCTETVLELATVMKRPVILASTSEVYGKGTSVPFREDQDMLIGPPSNWRWSYACSKAMDEFLALAYSKEQGLPVVVVRLFNTVGPRQTGRYGMVMPRLVAQAMTNAALTVYGDGMQTRSFCHVYDTVEALIALATSGADVYGEVFNVGAQEEVSMRALAERVLSTIKSQSSIKFIPYDVAYQPGFEDMQRRVPDISKIQRSLGWVPKRSLNQIIHDVANPTNADHETLPSGLDRTGVGRPRSGTEAKR